MKSGFLLEPAGVVAFIAIISTHRASADGYGHFLDRRTIGFSNSTTPISKSSPEILPISATQDSLHPYLAVTIHPTLYTGNLDSTVSLKTSSLEETSTSHPKNSSTTSPQTTSHQKTSSTTSRYPQSNSTTTHPSDTISSSTLHSRTNSTSTHPTTVTISSTTSHPPRTNSTSTHPPVTISSTTSYPPRTNSTSTHPPVTISSTTSYPPRTNSTSTHPPVTISSTTSYPPRTNSTSTHPTLTISSTTSYPPRTNSTSTHPTLTISSTTSYPPRTNSTSTHPTVTISSTTSYPPRTNSTSTHPTVTISSSISRHSQTNSTITHPITHPTDTISSTTSHYSRTNSTTTHPTDTISSTTSHYPGTNSSSSRPYSETNSTTPTTETRWITLGTETKWIPPRTETIWVNPATETQSITSATETKLTTCSYTDNNTTTSIGCLTVQRYFSTIITIRNTIVINNYNVSKYKEEISIKDFAAFEVNLINYYDCSSQAFYFAKLCDSCPIVKVSKASNSIEGPSCPDCPANVIPKPEPICISVGEREALVGRVFYGVEHTGAVAGSTFTLYNSTWKGNTTGERLTGRKGTLIPGGILAYHNATMHPAPHATGPTGKSDIAPATRAAVSIKSNPKALCTLAGIIKILEQSGGVENSVDSEETVVFDSASKTALKRSQPVERSEISWLIPLEGKASSVMESLITVGILAVAAAALFW